MCPACRRYIVVATIPAFERTRSRPVPRQVLLIYDAAGVSFVAAEGMAAYMTPRPRIHRCFRGTSPGHPRNFVAAFHTRSRLVRAHCLVPRGTRLCHPPDPNRVACSGQGLTPMGHGRFQLGGTRPFPAPTVAGGKGSFLRRRRHPELILGVPMDRGTRRRLPAAT